METLFKSIVGATLTLENTLIILGTALALGIVISLVYIITNKNEGFAQTFAITVIMLPMIIAIIILLVGDNVARAFSLAGAFTIVRFRSTPGDPKDIAYIFFTLAVGLAAGMGYVAYGILFTIILCLVMIVLKATKFAQPKNSHMILKVVVPENLDYQGLFDDLFPTYAVHYRLKRVKTVDFGALFELVYYMELKNNANQKEFIDKIRERNGNLNVILVFKEFEDKIYDN